MLKPSADLKIGPEDNRYTIVVAISKRAREIASEAEERGEILEDTPVNLAVHDFIDKKFSIVQPKCEN